MSFRIKLDENLGRTHQRFLQSLGYDTELVVDERLSGASDEAVWKRVCEEDRFFITLDIDFSDIRRYQPGSHPGVLLLRPETRGRQSVLQVLQRVCEEFSLQSLYRCVAVADATKTRVRRPPEV
ncbi:MAG: DUF5615 family PIN-like protein [Armatimonadota bacterium]|nr:DUF5615 family PIN-like protein [bacterium]MDW8321488.1 DUF5615 family PIN-like protein [Armatimonadota bacterium]